VNVRAAGQTSIRIGAGRRRGRGGGRSRVGLAGALALLCSTVFVGSGCGSDERADPTPRAEALDAREAPPQTRPIASTAPPGRERLADASGGDAARGEEHYVQLCASCHGPRGDGDGPLAAALDPRPARHSDGHTMNALSDEHLFRIIKQGGAAVGKSALMAPWDGTLDDSQIWDVVAFLRSIADPPYGES
jgi:mono/diheme cytochrome c family protein